MIRAARQLFQSKGLHATTTSEIAELADVAKGTLFFHATSKDALLVTIFQKDVARPYVRWLSCKLRFAFLGVNRT
jgi:AcrR family transcriptional regulator